MKPSVSNYIARFLKSKDIDTVFELSGGMIMHFLDAMHQENVFNIVNVYHEQAASFAADAMGRLSGRPGVAIGTSGPGALNLLTGVGSCYFDSSPAIFITGQVNRHEQKGLRSIRQLGFQETDIVSVATPITKWAVRVRKPEEIIEILPRAYALAMSGRPGPVLIDIPMDIFRAAIPLPLEADDRLLVERAVSPRPEQLAEVVSLLREAKRPLVLAGNGVRAAGQADLLRSFVESCQLPVVNSLLASDILPYEHPLRVGMIGTYGNRWANLAIAESDLLLVLGSRLDIRQTGADTRSFAAGRKIIHIDVDAGEMNNRVEGCIAIHADIGAFLSAFIASVRAAGLHVSRGNWLRAIADLRARWPDTTELSTAQGINPNVFMHALSKDRSPVAYCVDVGLHQMWAAQSIEIGEGARFITSGGMGAMGFALPAGIGAAFHSRCSRPVVVVAGDGGFQLNIQELQTVAHHSLPIKMVIMNNNCHGMTRQFQDTYFSGRYVGTVWGYSAPKFTAVAEAYGIEARHISRPDQVQGAIEWLWLEPMKPQLLEVVIETSTNAYPKMAFGKPISEMEPFAKPIEMEST